MPEAVRQNKWLRAMRSDHRYPPLLSLFTTKESVDRLQLCATGVGFSMQSPLRGK